VAGTVGQMIAPLCGAPAEAEEAAVALGEAMQLTNCLRDVGEDLRMDRVYLPQEALEAHGVRLDELRAGQVTPAYRRLMRELAEVARQLYRKGFQGLRHLSQGRPAIALAALQYQGILDKLEAQGWDNLNRRVSLRTHERMALVPRALLLR
jgi:phytoene synthase